MTVTFAAERGGGFAEEGGAALAGLDEGVGGVGVGDGEGEAGEAGAGADVGDALAGEDVAEEEWGEGIEEVLDCHLNGVGDGGEAVGAVLEEEGVVAGEEVEVGGGEGDGEIGSAGEEGLLEDGDRVRCCMRVPHGSLVRRGEGGTLGNGRRGERRNGRRGIRGCPALQEGRRQSAQALGRCSG